MAQWSRGVVKSFKTAASLSAYRAVYLSAANTVNYPQTTTNVLIGVTLDAASSGVDVPVQLINGGGSALMIFNDTATSASVVGYATATGKAVAAISTLTSNCIGILNGSVNATATIAEVIFFHNQVTIG